MTSPVTMIALVIDHSFVPGDDLATIVCDHLRGAIWPDASTGVRDGDIIVVTSKVVAKAEGRISHANSREAAIDDEIVRVVATKQTPRGRTTIGQTAHGLVLAAAGVDASNTERGTVVALPIDPDASAARLKAAIEEEFAAHVGVVITDTMGRPWRLGVTDVAIGSAGLRVLDDFTGRVDSYGNTLEMTVVAVADEIASAVELVSGKLTGAPLSVIRGLSHHLTADDVGARSIVRPLEEDLFWLGTAEALDEGAKGAAARRRTIRHFTDAPVDRAVVERAIGDALLAPAPHHSQPFKFIVFHADDLDHERRRTQLLDAMRDAWVDDLASIDARTPEEIDRRVARGDLLRTAPVVVIPIVDLESGAHSYPDERRSAAERDMFLVAGGAAVENMMIRIAAEGLGSAWISSTLFAPDVVRAQFALGPRATPLGAVAIGHPQTSPPERPKRRVGDYLIDPIASEITRPSSSE